MSITEISQSQKIMVLLKPVSVVLKKERSDKRFILRVNKVNYSN